MKKKILDLVEEIIDAQKAKLLICGRHFVPKLTFEDLLQPNDYPELENNPHFRFEEGLLKGEESIRAALFALFQEDELICDSIQIDQ